VFPLSYTTMEIPPQKSLTSQYPNQHTAYHPLCSSPGATPIGPHPNPPHSTRQLILYLSPQTNTSRTATTSSVAFEVLSFRASPRSWLQRIETEHLRLRGRGNSITRTSRSSLNIIGRFVEFAIPILFALVSFRVLLDRYHSSVSLYLHSFCLSNSIQPYALCSHLLYYTQPTSDVIIPAPSDILKLIAQL